jgi:parallel beta-helix repeat protein
MFDSIHYGIRVDAGGSAAITHNHITHIHDSPLSGIQTGIGILVGRFAEGQTGSATISHNVIDDYQKAGIVVDNSGSSATIDHNTVVGVGPTPLIAQNGIQVSRGANAQVDHNDVSGNLYAPQTTVSTGILLFNPGTVAVGHNTVHANDVGIYAQSLVGFPGYGLAKVVLDHNEVPGSTFDGIDLDGITGAVVSHNQVSNSTQGNGIALFDNSTGNTLDHNESDNNGNDGIFVEAGSTGNTFSHNRMNGNGNFDAEDLSTGSGTAGTGNTWDHNQGSTSSPPGLLS